LPEEVRPRSKPKFERLLEKHKHEYAPEDIAKIEEYQNRQANQPEAPPALQGDLVEAAEPEARPEAASSPRTEMAYPASTGADWDDSSLLDQEEQEPAPPQSPTPLAGQQDAPLNVGASAAPRDDASATPTDNRLDEARSPQTQEGTLIGSHEKIACAYYIPHQEEATTRAREGSTPTPSETIQFIVDVLGDKRAKKFLKNWALRSDDESCVGNAGNRIEVKIGNEQGVAVPRHVHCASNYKLCSLLLVVPNTFQCKRTARPSWSS
jgi:hypothetical protein